MISKNRHAEKQHMIFIRDEDSLIFSDIENPRFSPDDLNKERSLCKMQVHRKIKLTTGKSTSIYIRHRRSSQSVQYLQKADWPVSQSAFKVDFKTIAITPEASHTNSASVQVSLDAPSFSMIFK